MAKRTKADASLTHTPTRNMRRILVRVPPDLAEWVDDAAEEFGLSRDLFVRQLLLGCREGFAAVGNKGSAEQRLMAKVQKQVTHAINGAIDQSLTRVVKLSESGVRNQPRPRRRST